MSGHPACPKCKQEIAPGSMIDFVTLDDEPRIVMPGDGIMSHVTCPEPT